MTTTITSSGGSIVLRDPDYPISRTPLTEYSHERAMDGTNYTFIKTPVEYKLSATWVALSSTEKTNLLNILEYASFTFTDDTDTYAVRLQDTEISTTEDSRIGYTITLTFLGRPT